MANNLSQKLAQQIWAIADSLRGNMDASKFKDYILGVIFYRYLSARTESYMNDLLKNDHLTYREALADPDMAPTVREWAIEALGYVIEPEDLFDSFVARISTGSFSIEDFETAITRLTDSTIGQKSEAAFAHLFDAMNLKDADLGREVSDRTRLISTVIQKIYDTPFAKDSEAGDVLGTAYMILIGLFQSGAGKKGGEFFTPTCVSTLLAQITTLGLDEVKNVCDGCAGSGSLLLEVARNLSTHRVGHFYGQEKTGTTYNLLRMNLIMHGVPYTNFTVFNDDTLCRDNFYEGGEPIPFDIQVENPPYSAPNTASAKKYEEDPRYKSAGVLAPKTKADLAFVEGMVYHMAEDGRVAVLLPHGVLFRGGAEEDIRKYLVNKLNVIDAVIGLAPNLFHGTGIPVCVLFLKKKRNGNADNILFIDAAKYYEKIGKNNQLRASDIKRIVDCVRDRKDIPGFSRKVPLSEIKANSYNMNIPRYVDSTEKPEQWDVFSLMFGGIPEQELSAFESCFTAFPGLKDELFSRGEHSLYLRAENVKETFYGNTAVQGYIARYADTIAGMEGLLKSLLIDRLESLDLHAEEGHVTEELFARLADISLIDRYEAYEILVKEWAVISADIEIIHSEGFEAVNAVEPNVVTKKKDREIVEIQDGVKGRIFPFEFIQRIRLPHMLRELEQKKADLDTVGSEMEEFVDGLSDDEKDYDADGVTLYNREKNLLNTKVLAIAVRNIKKEHGKNAEFDEDTIEFKILTLAALMEKERNAKASVKALADKLDREAEAIIKSLSREEALALLHEKWIAPFIRNMSELAHTVLDGCVRRIEALTAKYAVTFSEEDQQIKEVESSLAEMLGQIKGTEEDNLGVEEWIRFLGGAT